MREERRFIPRDVGILLALAAVVGVSVGLFFLVVTILSGIEFPHSLALLTAPAGFLWLWRERRLSSQRWALRFGAVGLVGWIVFLGVLTKDEPQGLLPVSTIILANFALLWTLRVKWRRRMVDVPLASESTKHQSSARSADALEPCEGSQSHTEEVRPASSSKRKVQLSARWPMLLFGASLLTLFLFRPVPCRGFLGCLVANGARAAVISVEAAVIALFIWIIRREKGIFEKSFSIVFCAGVLFQIGLAAYQSHLSKRLSGLPVERVKVGELDGEIGSVPWPEPPPGYVLAQPPATLPADFFAGIVEIPRLGVSIQFPASSPRPQFQNLSQKFRGQSLDIGYYQQVFRERSSLDIRIDKILGVSAPKEPQGKDLLLGFLYKECPSQLGCTLKAEIAAFREDQERKGAVFLKGGADLAPTKKPLDFSGLDVTFETENVDLISEVRKRWPGLEAPEWDDERILRNLMDPARFRAAFPQLANLSDAFIARNMKRYAESRGELESIGGDSLLKRVEDGSATVLHFQRGEHGRVWYVRQSFILRRGYVFSVGLQSESRETLVGLTAQWFIQSLTFQ